jgi:hypothetical protein
MLSLHNGPMSVNFDAEKLSDTLHCRWWMIGAHLGKHESTDVLS